MKSIIDILFGPAPMNDSGALKQQQLKIEALQAELTRARQTSDDLIQNAGLDVAALSDELKRTKERHSKASRLCHELKTELKTLEERIPELEQQARTGNNETTRKYHSIQNAHVDACRAFSQALWGPDHEPVYNGDSISGGWPGIAAKRAEQLRHQNIGLKAALSAFVPWFNFVLRNYTDDTTVIHNMGKAPGSLHELVLRRKDVRVLREILEAIQ